MKSSVVATFQILCFLVLSMIAVVAVRPMHAAEISWDSITGGDWHTATNWSGNAIPGVSDDVTIDQPGNLQITIQAPASVNSLTTQETIFLNHQLTLAEGSLIQGHLTMGDSSSGTLDGPGDLIIDGTLNWQRGWMRGTGATILTATSNTIIAPGSHQISRLFENAGHVSLLATDNPDLSFNNGTFKNLATGTFDLHSASLSSAMPSDRSTNMAPAITRWPFRSTTRAS